MHQNVLKFGILNRILALASLCNNVIIRLYFSYGFKSDIPTFGSSCKTKIIKAGYICIISLLF